MTTANRPAPELRHSLDPVVPVREDAAGSVRGPGPTLAAAGFGALIVFGSAEAYRFFPGTDGIQPFFSGELRPAEDAVRWSSESWAPGSTLVWEVPQDPDFATLFGGEHGALPHFRTALAEWSNLPNAEISWRAESSVGAAVDERSLQDGRNTFYIHAGHPAGGYASLWVERGSAGEPWELFECDFALGGWATQPTPPNIDPQSRLAEAVMIITHELGHCLGLAHAASYSVSGRVRQQYFRSQGQSTAFEHPRDPSMSYGIARRATPFLSPDDETAAALLRPAGGWRTTTGNISGSLRAGGAPAPWVHVWALPVGTEDALFRRIGAFSDGNGDFVIEGLAPGEYWLWTHPVIRQNAHGLLTQNGAPVDLDDTVLGYPVRVAAGRTTGGVSLTLRIGRTGREPPTATRPSGNLGSSIVDRWGTPCSGIRVRATRPYPADGPHAASEPDRFLRGDAWYTSELTLEWSAGAADTVFDWTGLYRNWQYATSLGRVVYATAPRSGAPFFDLNLPRWEIERTGGAVRHTLQMDWPASAEAGLRFRDGSCGGERQVVCTVAGCGVR